MNNDELIAAGHELAKCLDSNTPLLDIAKLLSKMATQLDVTTAALREKTKQCEQLAAENAALKEAHPQPFGQQMMKSLDAYEKYQDDVPETGMLDAFFILRDSIRVETPATDAFLLEVRAQGVELLAEHLSGMGISASETSVREFAAQLRNEVKG
ncbi:hypothetical protein R2207_001477 [Cronobacter sakazakii]|nr:hypothetical protein [Cronobacter sakazakii]